MKWWSKRLSMVIAKTASKSVAFEAAKIGDSVLAGQCAVLTREVEGVGAYIDEVVLEDLARNVYVSILIRTLLCRCNDSPVYVCYSLVFL